MSWEANLLQQRCQCVDVVLLVEVRVRLLCWVLRTTEQVEVRHIGGEATDRRTIAGALENGGEHLSGGLDVSGPTKPTRVTSVEVEPDVILLQFANGVGYEFLAKRRKKKRGQRGKGADLVRALSICALCDAQVGDEIGETVGFNDEDNADVGVFWKIKLLINETDI